MEGWIKLHRGLLESNVWTCEPFSRGQAWVDLLLLANHKDTFFYKRGHKIDVKRGQLGRSTVELSDRWKWSRSKVNKFLKDLEKEQQIEQQKTNVTQIITIINYDEYQQKEQQTEQQKSSRSAAEEQQKDTYKNVNNDNNDKNEKKNIRIGDFKNWKGVLKNDEVFIKNLFQELRGKFTFLDLQTLHKDLDIKLNNYETYAKQFEIKLNDEKHLKNSFRKFTLSHWNKNTDQIIRLKK